MSLLRYAYAIAMISWRFVSYRIVSRRRYHFVDYVVLTISISASRNYLLDIEDQFGFTFHFHVKFRFRFG